MPRRNKRPPVRRYQPADNCQHKQRFLHQASAEEAALSHSLTYQTELRAYKCPHCNGWHLTSVSR